MPKGVRLKFVCGSSFFTTMMQQGPVLEFTAAKYIRSGTILTFSVGSNLLPPDIGHFKQLRPFPKLQRYQAYLYAGSEDKPTFIFGLITQIGAN